MQEFKEGVNFMKEHPKSVLKKRFIKMGVKNGCESWEGIDEHFSGRITQTKHQI
jgi:hypothetical protein